MKATLHHPNSRAPLAYSFSGGSSAISAQQEKDLKQLRDLEAHKHEPVTCEERRKAFDALSQVYEECSEPNWNGEGAPAISPLAYFEATTFLRQLPSRFPVPELVPDPSGAIGLEWHVKRHHVYVVTFAGEQLLTYAGIFGNLNTTHGTEEFTETIPVNVLNHLRRLFMAD